MNRRKTMFALLALGAATGPLASIAQQQSKVWRVGFLTSRRVNFVDTDSYYGPFRQGMRELGYIEGKNLVIEWRSAEGDNARLPGLAAELVKLKVDVIVTAASPATRAAQKSTATIPIVMVGIGDPVAGGFIRSLARPEGNTTGVSNMARDIREKQIDMLLGVVPKASRFAVLMNPSNQAHIIALETIETAARLRNVKMVRADAQSPQEIDDAFPMIRQQKAGALLVSPDPLFTQQRNQIAQLAAKHRLPAIGSDSDYAEAGGLMSYGTNRRELILRAATYVEKIFKGAKPSDLPIEQPTRFELVINLKTAKALGITVPSSVLIRADRVIG